jgi:GTPase SAR1 family protein
VLGQFKRGKSTLVNALIGEAVLPTSVVPLTSIPTFLRSGSVRKAAVLFQNGRAPEEFVAMDGDDLKSFLSQFVTETANPQNRLGVSHVEVTHPAPILEKGVALIDTPGIGSTFRHNTETALNFLPQCDAAIFVVSADPPLTEVEVEFLEQVRGMASNLFFILNKVDYLDIEDRRMALEFLGQALSDTVGASGETPIFCVSAKQGLQAQLTDDAQLWRHSGLAEVERHLIEFLASEKSSVLHEAIARKAAGTIADSLLQLHLILRSLQMPLDDLRERLQVFEQEIRELERERQIVRDLLAGDQKRVIESLENHAERTRTEARKYLEGILTDALAREVDGKTNESHIQEALVEAIPGYFERRLGATTEMFRKRMTETLRPHQERTDHLIETIRRTVAELFEVPLHAPESSTAFEMVRQPYWVTHQWSSTMSPLPEGWIDRFLPRRVRMRRVKERLTERIRSMVFSNVENLRWATYQSVTESIRQFGLRLEEELSATTEATHGAIQAAVDRRRSQSETVGKETARLESAITELEVLRAGLRRERSLLRDGRTP